MSMTDPIADLLARIRNAQMARHKTMEIPSSRMKIAIVKILMDEGYISSLAVVEDRNRSTLRIHLKYGSAGEKAITGLQRVSRPGRRMYCGKSEIPKVLNGLGITILSTPKGVLSGKACRDLGVGGEILCNIW